MAMFDAAEKAEAATVLGLLFNIAVSSSPENLEAVRYIKRMAALFEVPALAMLEQVSPRIDPIWHKYWFSASWTALSARARWDLCDLQYCSVRASGFSGMFGSEKIATFAQGIAEGGRFPTSSPLVAVADRCSRELLALKPQNSLSWSWRLSLGRRLSAAKGSISTQPSRA